MDQRCVGVDWCFNAWGGVPDGLYFPWDLDDVIAAKMLNIKRAQRYRTPFVLEGGAIHVDGEGTIMVTEACLLAENRNPGVTRQRAERVLKDYLGG
jgi:agmatine deiminase